jgi:hypothetical protein
VDLVQLHFKADFKDSLRIIENFLIKNKELKQGTLSNHVQASSVEASQTKRLESYHNIKPFSNDEFLKSRGISNDTLNHPYFKGRIHNSLSENGNHLNTAFPISSEKGLIGFEIRNKDFKSVEDFKNDGFWRSNVDHSKKVSDLVVNESAIDALSHFQLKNDGKKHFNSLSTQDVYLSSAGSVSGRQIQLLSKMLDKGLSRKNDFLENVPKSSYKDIDQVKEQRTGEGKIVRDENGESVKIASIAYNKPQNLVLAMDNDTSGALLTTKILGRLQTKDYFPKGENPALNNSEISPYMNKKTNVGRISWQIDSDNKSEVKNGVEKINKHFEDLNKKFSDKIVEGKPFEINYSCKEKTGQVDVEFTNNNKNWSLVVDSVKKLKFEDSTRLKIDKPLTKDFNDDLRGKLGVDPILKKRYDLAHSAHEFQMKRQDSKELSKSPGEKKDLSIEEQISRVMDKPSKKGISL